MSPLAKYLKSLRTRRNLTNMKVSQRAQLELVRYNEIESIPELVPAAQLGQVFGALNITPEEYIEFFTIARLTIAVAPAHASPPKSEDATDTVDNLTSFKDKRGLNGRKKNLGTRKKLTGDLESE